MEYDRRKADRLGMETSQTCGFLYFQEVQLMEQGMIHSIESMGLVDGPGIRTVVFLPGCQLRCQYCHNPDTWAQTSSSAQCMNPEELVRRLVRFKPYYGQTGGVTFSGGEPLLQKDFLLETLRLCRQADIHVCLDTAGCGVGGYEEILSLTDLVLFDVKHYTDAGYHLVTGHEREESLKFLETAQHMGIPLWIRHVVVPGLTDGEAHYEGLREYLKTLKHVQRVELLPYHTLGVSKYEALGIPYSLKGVPPMREEELTLWQQILNEDFIQETK